MYIKVEFQTLGGFLLLLVLNLNLDSTFKKFIFTWFSESLLKGIKSVLIYLKSSHKIFQFLSWLFGYVERTAWLERQG